VVRAKQPFGSCPCPGAENIAFGPHTDLQASRTPAPPTFRSSRVTDSSLHELANFVAVSRATQPLTVQERPQTGPRSVHPATCSSGSGGKPRGQAGPARPRDSPAQQHPPGRRPPALPNLPAAEQVRRMAKRCAPWIGEAQWLTTTALIPPPAIFTLRSGVL
jgi:hypothetical protein